MAIGKTCATVTDEIRGRSFWDWIPKKKQLIIQFFKDGVGFFFPFIG